MPKLGMEPIRRAALVKATIGEVGRAGSLDVTVGQIAKRAGMSSALAHHYFGAKDQILLAAMRHILSEYGAAVRRALADATGPHARLAAIIRTGFAPDQFQGDVVSAWLTFYVRAQTSPEVRRLLTVYQRRLRTNLLHDLRPLVGATADGAAETLAALIDGFYIRAALGQGGSNGDTAATRVLATLDAMIGAPR